MKNTAGGACLGGQGTKKERNAYRSLFALGEIIVESHVKNQNLQGIAPLHFREITKVELFMVHNGQPNERLTNEMKEIL